MTIFYLVPLNLQIPNGNNVITGYHFISQPSLSNAGSTGFFVSNQMRFIERDDLSEVTADFETQWIEIESDLHHNMICGVIYRHPNGNLDSFMTSINNYLDKVNNENKYCLVVGDFNINLLNTDSHTATEEFFDMITSYYFSPHILQPTRITHHSATLIDNILFNSTEHHTVSGNIVFDLTDYLPNEKVNTMQSVLTLISK